MCINSRCQCNFTMHFYRGCHLQFTSNVISWISHMEPWFNSKPVLLSWEILPYSFTEEKLDIKLSTHRCTLFKDDGYKENVRTDFNGITLQHKIIQRSSNVPCMQYQRWLSRYQHYARKIWLRRKISCLCTFLEL